MKAIQSPLQIELIDRSRESTPESELIHEDDHPLLEAIPSQNHSSESHSRPGFLQNSYEHLILLLKICSPAVEISSSLMIVGLITLLGDCCRGVLFPVQWALCQYCRGSLVSLGYLIAVFSFGRLCATLPLGYYCDVYRHKKALTIANAIVLAGTLAWANVSQTKNLYLLYIAQFFLGVGSGSLGVTRSYVVEQVAKEHRTEMLAYLTALQYAGFTVSPVLGAWLSDFGMKTSIYWSFGLPAYFLAVLAVLSIVLLQLVFQNIEYNHNKKSKSSTQNSRKESNGNAHYTALQSQNEINAARQWLVVAVLFLTLNVTVRGSIAVYETMGAEIWSNDYRMNTVQLGSLVTISGGVGTFQLLFYRYFWSSRYDDVTVLLVGMVVMMVAQVVMHSYNTPLPTVQQFIASIIMMYGFGYPLAQTATLGAFSKLQSAGPQAALMGYFATAGSLARIVIPIMTGYLDKLQDNSPFLLIIFMVSLSYAAVVLLKGTISACLSSSANTSAEDSIEAGTDTAPASPITVESLIRSLSRNEALTIVTMLLTAVASVVIFVASLNSVPQG